jgi:hypothetical protein
MLRDTTTGLFYHYTSLLAIPHHPVVPGEHGQSHHRKLQARSHPISGELAARCATSSSQQLGSGVSPSRCLSFPYASSHCFSHPVADAVMKGESDASSLRPSLQPTLFTIRSARSVGRLTRDLKQPCSCRFCAIDGSCSYRSRRLG